MEQWREPTINTANRRWGRVRAACPGGRLAAWGLGGLLLLVASADLLAGPAAVSLRPVLRHQIRTEQFGEWAAWHPDGRRLAVAGLLDHRISVFDVVTGQEARRLPGHAGGVKALAYSADGRQLAVGRGEVGAGDQRYSVSLWDAESGALLTHIVEPDRDALRELGVLSLALSSNGRYLAVAYFRDTALYEMTRDGPRRIAKLAVSPYLAFSPDGSKLAASRYERLVLYGVPGGERLQEIPGPAFAALSFTPDGRQVASAGGSEIAVFDLDGGTARQVPTGHIPNIGAVAYSADGRYLVSGSNDVRIWETSGWGLVATLTEHRHVQFCAFSPDGKHLAAVGGERVTIWALGP